MKIWYTVLLLVLTVSTAFTAVRARRKKGELWNIVWQMLLVVLTLDISCLLTIFVPSDPAVLFFQGIYYAAYIWLLTSYLRFVYYYAESRHIPKTVRIAIFCMSFLDTVSLAVANIFFSHAFTMTTQTARDGFTYRVFNNNTFFYNLHQIFGYAAGLAIIALIAYRQYKAESVYRVRYTLLMGLFIVMCMFQAFFLAIDLPLDMILPCFNVLVISVYYLVSRYIPKDLTIRILTFASSSLQDGIICFDNNESLLYTNTEAERFVEARATGENAQTMFLRLYHDRGLDKMDALCWRDSFQHTDRILHYQFLYQAIYDAGGIRIGFYFTIQDRTSEMEALAAERYRAVHDPLTGLYNLDGFLERVEALLAKDPATPRFMLASNIKDFKLVNNLFGIDKGNEILTKTAELLKRFRLHEDDIAGRFGGDRFVMVMSRDRFREEIFMHGMEELAALINSSSYRLCVHLGVYAIDDPRITVSSMCDRAFMAINTIQQENRSMIVYFSEQLLQTSLRQKRILSEVEDAIANGDMTIYLQPQIDNDNRVLGAEALVRWQHPQRGVITPDHFIPVLEEAGMISQLDLIVWEQACKQLQAWRGTDKEHLYISVNISPRDFYYIDLYKTFTGLVEQYAIPPRKLCLEITETALMTEPEKQQALVKRLRAYGFEVEIDDFGSGYSSLSMLKDLPVDTLKMDLKFLREVEDNLRSRTILSSVVSLSRSLHINVIAEGVENKMQLQFLKSLGCDCFQGYYFSRPLPVADFEEYFSTSTE
ncbi:MAG: EAL domain-containing protein [Lachnospiraceae bacterium]|nr:EAL domain-containing protein [Lachnospiraceae bacterium]